MVIINQDHSLTAYSASPPSHLKSTIQPQVCSEEKLSAIQDRYGSVNAHAKGYMWKRLGSLLDMNATLEANGIPDESKIFDQVGIDEDQWLPALHLYFRYWNIWWDVGGVGMAEWSIVLSWSVILLTIHFPSSFSLSLSLSLVTT